MADHDERSSRPQPNDSTRDRPHDAPPGDVPNEQSAEREFRHTDASSLPEAMDLTDEDGDDVRQYSGEPVPTEHGQVIPQQMAVGRERTVGDGEWPDAPPRGDSTDDGSRRRDDDEREG